jgi:hypothetical protein
VRFVELLAITAAACSSNGAPGLLTASQLPVATQRWFW